MAILIEDAKYWKDSPIFISMAQKAALDPKKNQDGSQKVADDGTPLWSGLGLNAVRLVDGVPSGSDQNYSLAVKKQPVGGVKFQQAYRLSGEVKIVGWGSVDYSQGDDGKSKARANVKYSITADAIVPVKSGGGEQ